MAIEERWVGLSITGRLRHRMGFATEWTFWKGPGVLHHIHQADASEEDIVSLYARLAGWLST